MSTKELVLPTIKIVTHVYSESLPQYAFFLRAQLSSLALFSGKSKVSVVVCCTPSDRNLFPILDDLKHHLDLTVLFLPKSELFRRAIGRNIAALASQEDVIWFTDVDHYFGPCCLLDLQQVWASFEKKPVLVWPRQIQIHTDHERGDRFWKEYTGSAFVEIDENDFTPKTYHKAIGGVQIVDGQFARKYGYLNGSKKWLSLVDETKPFACFRDDVKFRGVCESKGECRSIEISDLYRLRHSAVTYKGRHHVQVAQEKIA